MVGFENTKLNYYFETKIMKKWIFYVSQNFHRISVLQAILRDEKDETIISFFVF